MSRVVISTDWETYKAALLEAGLDPALYAAMEAKLKPFEKLSFTFRSPTEVKATWDDYQDALEDWQTHRHRGPFFRSLNAHNCQGCVYKEPCTEALRDGDVEALLQIGFMKTTEGPRSWMYGVPEESKEEEV
jgi:hypothetical protein